MYTIQISKWRKAEQLGVQFKDVTVKSGDKLFAPTWDFLMEYKQDLDEEKYVSKYLPLMRESYKNNKDKWLELCSMDSVAIACYCKAGEFCHRHLIVDILEKYAKLTTLNLKEWEKYYEVLF